MSERDPSSSVCEFCIYCSFMALLVAVCLSLENYLQSIGETVSLEMCDAGRRNERVGVLRWLRE